MDPEDRSVQPHPRSEETLSVDRSLLDRLRADEAEAGHRFVEEHYSGVYRHLFYLTGCREAAEDLVQETFLQAWRSLDTFEGRAPLRAWLHRIAHREFLQSLRRQRPVTSLAEVGDLPAPQPTDVTDAAELRVIISRLPLQEREVVVLRYLEGYTCDEISEIVDAPVTTVNYRLLEARARLRRELGEGDLAYLNQPPEAVLRRWAWLPLEALTALEARLSTARNPRPAPAEQPTIERSSSDADGATAARKGKRRMNEKANGMSRRRLLGAAGSAAAAVAAAGFAGAAEAVTPQNEVEIIDDRLNRKVTLGIKAMALADLCETLRSDTGITIAAGQSVADEKVTLFCEKVALRDVMRQLSRPFGYTWLRSGKPGEYRYELVQDLRSQLLEEELRNRDRNAALLALNLDIERYRPYLSLSPEEALARAKSAAPADKALLEKLGEYGWGPIQLYFRLSPQQQAALRTGQELQFRAEPSAPGDLKLPPDLERGILACQLGHRVVRSKDGGLDGRSAEDAPDALPLTAVPELRAQARLKIQERELGQFTLQGESGFHGGGLDNWAGGGPWASGVSPSVLKPDNAVLNTRLASDPDLRRHVTLTPMSSSVRDRPREAGDRPGDAGPKLTSADLLEALHRATGMPIIADFCTRLYARDAVPVRGQPLYDALNSLADRMRLRWNKEGSWLQIRSASYYEDRLKEVPNRLLTRWAASRRQHGMLTLDDLVEIAGLSDAQLDAAEMAEGARERWGLVEWDLARDWRLRPHLRFLAGFTPDQRREAQSAAGLPFTRMPLAQQQQFLTLALGSGGTGLQSLQELAGAALRVDYTQPGWFTWRVPGPYRLRFVVPLGPDRRVPFPQIRERTREAALQALRRVDPAIREAAERLVRYADPRLEAARPEDEAQIVPTERDLVVLYIPDLANKRSIHVVWGVSISNWNPGWPG